ncbi:SatD family protein [Fulvivirga imtechensis]|nr:SatD family protein [Fulvivirga imtechensis]
MKHCIIMADIIGSSQQQGKLLMTHFKSVVNGVNTALKDKIRSPLTITLGDEFQGVVKDLDAAVEVIFWIDELMLSADPAYKLRFVVNYGAIDTAINEEVAYEMLGEGLTRARHLLGAMKSEDTEILINGIDDKDDILNMAFKLYRSFYNDWLEKDRPVASTFLKIEDYKEVARIYKKDISTMWRREKSLKIDEFRTSRDLIRRLAHE